MTTSFYTRILLIFFLQTTAVNAQSVARWHTSMGNFDAELREDIVPITANNFIDLANQQFYDSLVFHRVIDDFVIQDGDPLGTGEGGPGYIIPDEFHPDLRHFTGAVSMANAGPNTGGSQYFITLTSQHHLNDLHSIFGNVVIGMDIVQDIGDVDTDGDDRPIIPVVIDSIRIIGVIYPHIEITSFSINESPDNSDNDGLINPLEGGEFHLTFKNWLGWADAEGLSIRLSSNDPRITIDSPPINIANFVNGDSSSPGSLDFTINTNEAFDAKLQLIVTANSLSENPYEIESEYNLSVSLDQKGFPLEVLTRSSAMIIDVDNNGSNEIVFADYGGHVHALDALGKSAIDSFPVATGGSIRTALAAGNLDEDDGWEIVSVNAINTNITAVDDNGEILFEYNTGKTLRTNPMIADVNFDGTNEIVVVSLTGDVFVLTSNGQDFPGFPVFDIGPTVDSAPAIADLNGDDYLDVIFISLKDGGSMHAISTKNGNELPGWPYLTESNSTNGPTVADIGNNNSVEIFAGFDNGHLTIINFDGSEKLNVDLGAKIEPGILFYDITNDGENEIIAIDADGFLHVMDSSGVELPEFPKLFESTTKATPILADLNDNGFIDIIFGDKNGNVQVFDMDNNQVENFPHKLGLEEVRNSAVIGDLDSDGDAELGFVTFGNLYVMDYKLSAVPGWSMFKGNPQRTGNPAGILTDINFDDQVIPKQTHLGNAYPNPFNPATTIIYQLETATHVRLEIFDMLGKKLKTLVNADQKSGEYKLTLSAPHFASGIYYYRLSTKNYQNTKKLLFLK